MTSREFAALPFHSAVAGDRDDVTAGPIAAGVTPDATQRLGWTALRGAAQTGASATICPQERSR